MISKTEFENWCTSFDGVSTEPHFEKTSYRTAKKIFATYDEKNHRACLKLTVKEQDLFSLHDKEAVYAVPNKWGQQGWTFFELGKVKKTVMKDALQSAFRNVSSGKK